jgi:hypothetical protein
VDVERRARRPAGRDGRGGAGGWENANNKFAEGRDRAAALREIREAYNLVYEKMFDAGVFEHKLGTLDEVIQYAAH